MQGGWVLANKKNGFILFFAFCCAVKCSLSFAQVTVSRDQEIMQIKGKWTKGDNHIGLNDPRFTRTQYPYAFARTDAIASIIKNIYPQPLGVEAKYYTSVGGWPVYKNGPAVYSFWSHYKSYYFNQHLNEILLAGETSTAVRVHINDFGLHFLTRDTITLIIDGKPTKIFTPLNPDGKWKGLPLYKFERWKPGNSEKSITKIVLIARSGKLPVTPLTQKQYLSGLKIFWQTEKQKMTERFINAEKEQQKVMDEMRNNKYLDAASRNKVLSALQKDIDKYAQTKEADRQKLQEGLDKKIQLIDQYISSHSDEEMRQPVITTSFGDFPGYFGNDGKQTAVTPVRIDPTYFKSTLPRYVPQFMVMEWNAETDAPGEHFRKLFEEGFPVEKLQALLDNDGMQVEKPPLVVKTDPANDPELKAIRKKAERYADSMLRTTNGLAAFYRPTFPTINTTLPDTLNQYAPPAKNERWLAAIPKKAFSAAELKIYLDTIDKKYTPLLLASGVKLPDVTSMNIGEISYSSAMFLLNGQHEVAAWLAIKAAAKSPGNILVMNNSGAILNACGFQPVAVPVLETVLEKFPDNSALQNNLGQAYIGLGDVSKATHYLQQAVSGNPFHPHANLSLAYIQHAKGNKSAALTSVENSLRGSFNNGAWNLLLKLKPDARLINYLKHRYKPPDYFNEDKYHLPRQCENVSEIPLLKGEYDAFRKMVEKVKKQFDAISEEEYKKGTQSMMNKVKDYKTSGIQRTPFTGLGNVMLLDLKLQLEDENEKLARAQHIYHKSIAELQDTYKAAYSKAKDCGEQTELANRYMQLMAFVTREYQKEWLPVWKDFFNDYAFWSMVAHPDKFIQKADYASTVSGYLGEMLRVAETHFLETSIDCNNDDEIKKQQEELKIFPPDCPVDIGLEFGIGSFSLDCEKIEYHFGGLLVADVVHSFKNHSTTIAIGAGLDLKFGGEKLKAGPIQGGFGAKGKMQYYLTFDGTHPSDQGLIWEAAIKYKQKIKTGIEGIEKWEEVETTNVNLSAKNVLSFHNGWSLDGTVYDQLDKILEAKPEKPLNKNIKIYKPQ